MLRLILNKLGYVSEEEAEARAQKRAIETIRRIKGEEPGDELFNAVRVSRKFGFKLVYALGDDNVSENAARLARDLLIDESRLANRLLPNIRVVNDTSLLR